MAINPKLLNPGERLVLSTRTHVKALIWPALVLIVTATVGGFLASLTRDNRGLWWSVIGVVGGLIVLVYSVWPFLVWLTTGYAITDRRLTTHRGVISRSGHDIPLARVSEVTYEKGLIDRILGCGTLIISDASDHGRVVLDDIPRVEEAQRVLSDLLHGSAQTGGHGDEGT